MKPCSGPAWYRSPASLAQNSAAFERLVSLVGADAVDASPMLEIQAVAERLRK